MTKKLVWRLGKLPTPSEVSELVKDKIITQEEAREVLFSLDEDRDKKSLESEIKFLRDLVERLSQNNRTRIVEVIKEVQKPYGQLGWYQPYNAWCYTLDTSKGISNIKYTNTAASGTIQVGNNQAFSGIKTF